MHKDVLDRRLEHVALQLRELVPSQSSDGPPQEGNSDSRRPKHVVLSDTIALVKDLQIRVLTRSPHCHLPFLPTPLSPFLCLSTAAYLSLHLIAPLFSVVLASIASSTCSCC